MIWLHVRVIRDSENRSYKCLIDILNFVCFPSVAGRGTSTWVCEAGLLPWFDVENCLGSRDGVEVESLSLAWVSATWALKRGRNQH